MKVPYAVLTGIQSSLDGARTDVEETAGSAPGTVDAGDLAPIATDLCARLAESAAGLSEALGGGSSLVADLLADYQVTDTHAAVRHSSARAALPGP